MTPCLLRFALSQSNSPSLHSTLTLHYARTLTHLCSQCSHSHCIQAPMTMENTVQPM